MFATALATRPWRYYFTAGTAFVFGLSMASNGVFTMGSPLHGLYGIGFCMVLVPTCFIAESSLNRIRPLSLWIAVIVLFYLWLMIVSFNPMSYKGLTQRISVFPMFGWFYFAGRALIQQDSSVQPTLHHAVEARTH